MCAAAATDRSLRPCFSASPSAGPNLHDDEQLLSDDFFNWQGVVLNDYPITRESAAIQGRVQEGGLVGGHNVTSETGRESRGWPLLEVTKGHCPVEGVGT